MYDEYLFNINPLIVIIMKKLTMIKKEIAVPVVIINHTTVEAVGTDALSGDALELQAIGKCLKEAGIPNHVGMYLHLENPTFRVYTARELVTNTTTVSAVKVSSEITFVEK